MDGKVGVGGKIEDRLATCGVARVDECETELVGKAAIAVARRPARHEQALGRADEAVDAREPEEAVPSRAG